ncbi:MAG: discoidin domain-containing protein [Sedimentisphaerales bacterium]|nr:discoidin domain-containing protein [Sedimentisphaerales bacterium]
MSWNHILSKALTIFIVIAICLAGSVSAQTTVYVDGSVSATGDGTLAAPYQTIAEALTLSNTDLVVLVAGGTYTNEPRYNDDISNGQTIIGSYDSSFTTSDPSVTPTIIDMGARPETEQKGVFYIRATSFTLENLIIQNSTTGEHDNTEHGGAIYVRNASTGTMRGVTFRNCAAKFENGIETGTRRSGGAVAIRDGSAVLFEDCVFDNCTAVGKGGAIYVRSGNNNVRLHRCLFTNCSAGNGASAIDDSEGSAQIEMINCIFANNGADVLFPDRVEQSDYLIRVTNNMQALIYNCTFVGNNNPAGYMFDIGNGSGIATKTIVNCIVANNTIGENGAGVAVLNYADGYDDATTLENNLFFSNSGLNPLDPIGANIIGSGGNIEGDPQFVDAANGDYHLSAGSPGEDAGQTLTFVLDDFSGRARPVGSAYDIGALEGQVPPPSVQNVIATATSSANANFGPEKTVDASGLNAWDQHDTTPTNMWLSSLGQEPPVQIQYEFDSVYKLDQMWIWNSNNSVEMIAGLGGLGVKTATIEYSTDGDTWETLADVPEFAQATGTDDYAHNTTVNFNGVTAKFVRITCTSSWGGGAQYGLSEVRFFYVPVKARNPKPANGAERVSTDVTLSWKEGIEAAEHNVYISTDEQAVIDGTVAPVTVAETSYGPLSLDLGTKYYWRVDEVNNTNTTPLWEGNTWSFTTSDYRVVDDFESYNDIPEGEEGSNLVYLTWIDGYDNPSTNGSTMGYVTGASLETAIVKSGHSAPLMYNNIAAGVSKVTANTNKLQSGSNWTTGGSPNELVIWVYGDADNPGTDRMYAEVGGVKRIFSGDIALEEWQQFTIDLTSLGINLNNVGTVTIGLEKIGATGGGGMVFIDDIMLHRSL